MSGKINIAFIEDLITLSKGFRFQILLFVKNIHDLGIKVRPSSPDEPRASDSRSTASF